MINVFGAPINRGAKNESRLSEKFLSDKIVVEGGQLADFFKKPIFAAILLIALVVGGIWAYISYHQSVAKKAEDAKKQQQQQQATIEAEKTLNSLATIDPAKVADQIASQLQIADSKAIETDKKSLLSAVEVRLSKDITVGTGTTVYGYSSVSDKSNNWTITFSNDSNTFVRARIPKEDYFGVLTAINRDYWKLNYAQALQIAEKNGGLDFREINEITGIGLVLKTGDPNGWLYWFVTYETDGNFKQFQIDANTGKLVTTE